MNKFDLSSKFKKKRKAINTNGKIELNEVKMVISDRTE